MKKRITILFFLLISLISFSKEISIFIKDQFGLPIKNVTVKAPNLIKFTDVNGEVSFTNNNEELKIQIEKDGYESQNFIFSSTDKKDFEIILQTSKIDKKLFFLAVKYNEYVNSSYFIDDLEDDSSLADNTIINFYRGDTLVKSLDYDRRVSSILLPYGNYTIRAFNIYNNNIEFNNISINKSSENFLVLNLKRETQIITGKIIVDKSFLGGVKLTFKDNFGNSFETTSDIEGNYSINLPENDYHIHAEKIGYKAIVENTEYLSQNRSNYNIHMTEIGSFLTGRVFDQNQTPLSNVTITLKTSEKEIIVQTDDVGIFKASTPKGIILIKAEKEGYYTNGTLKRIENFSTLDGINLILNEKIGSIKGTLINNLNTTVNFNLKLYDKHNNFFANSYTNENGYYEFINLPIVNEYFITVEKNDKIYFKSENIKLIEKETVEKNIIIEIDSINIILELLNQNKLLSNITVFINGTKFISDINGFINNYYSKDSLKKLNIEIPEFNLKKSFSVTEETTSPLKIQIDVSK